MKNKDVENNFRGLRDICNDDEDLLNIVEFYLDIIKYFLYDENQVIRIIDIVKKNPDISTEELLKNINKE